MIFKNLQIIVDDVSLYSRNYSSGSVAKLSYVSAYEATFSRTIKEVIYYKSGWGNEFCRVSEQVNKIFKLESLKGRSTTDYNTYFNVILSDGTVHSYHILYSGNWLLEIRQDEDSCKIKIGYTNDFMTDVDENKNFTTFEVAYLQENDEFKLGRKWQNFSRSYMLENDLSKRLMVVYNHWWAYEDKLINEEIFLANLEIAAELGIEGIVLDAGWFGDDDHWFDLRGDWGHVNERKFSCGIKYLADRVHEKQMKFGFWFEIEGLGVKSKLYSTHPEMIAKRDDITLNYLCFGAEKTVQWAIEVVANIIENYNCDWIKFDFNLDPGLGCNCLAHDHRLHDGLDAHVQGLYKFLKRLNEKYPEVVFENCSSGGQRADLKLLSHFHCSYLSDPDNVLHKHRCISGAAKYLPPNKQFHFMPSQTCGMEHERPFLNSDLSKMSAAKQKEVLRIGMLTFFGISHRLIDYGQEVLNLIKQELAFYKKYVRKFVQSGQLYAYEKGGANVYKYYLANELLVFIFAKEAKTISEVLINETDYQNIYDLDTNSKVDKKIVIDFAKECVKTYLIKK